MQAQLFGLPGTLGLTNDAVGSAETARTGLSAEYGCASRPGSACSKLETLIKSARHAAQELSQGVMHMNISLIQLQANLRSRQRADCKSPKLQMFDTKISRSRPNYVLLCTKLLLTDSLSCRCTLSDTVLKAPAASKVGSVPKVGQAWGFRRVHVAPQHMGGHLNVKKPAQLGFRGRSLIAIQDPKRMTPRPNFGSGRNLGAVTSGL